MTLRGPRRTLIGTLVAELWPGAPYESDSPAGPGVLGFAFDPQEGEDAFASDRKRPFRRASHTLAWIPPGCPVFSSSKAGGEYLVLRGVPAQDVGHADAAAKPLNDIVDAAALDAARLLRRVLISGTEPADEAHAAVETLKAILLRRLDAGSSRAADWLTPARRTKIDALLEARMGERLVLREIAQELGVSVGFLVLAFRVGLGETPHRYLMARRLARARQLLKATTWPISDIAQACGFADQAHLTRRLKAEFGLTPRVFRNAG